MKIFPLDTRQWIPRPLDDVFPFFADAANLERITPSWLSFRILSPQPTEMRVGATIDYGLRVHGVPLSWTSEITAWEPPYRFVDEQIRGPYRAWIHEHRFEESDGGTWVEDRVRYAVPGGSLIHKLFVQRDVERIFAHRQQSLKELFA